jgi:hypothetical protein
LSHASGGPAALDYDSGTIIQGEMGATVGSNSSQGAARVFATGTADVTVSLNPSSVPADGRTTSTSTARRDRRERPGVGNATITATDSSGSATASGCNAYAEAGQAGRGLAAGREPTAHANRGPPVARPLT